MVATHTNLRTPAPTTYFAGWDHLEFWVGNARQAAGFLSSAFGFTIAAYAGPETGVTDRCSWLLQQGDIRLVVSGALNGTSAIATHQRAHGDGVRDLAIRVTDVEGAYAAALERGAVGLRAPWSESDDFGTVVRATIATYGDTQHTFVGRDGYKGVFLPGFDDDNLPPVPAGPPVGLGRIDHVVGNVEKGQLKSWVDFYGEVLGFDELVHFDDAQITTEYSALMSTVVWDGSKVVLPINEPADGKKKSQIQEYLDFYGCPGVQHIAMRTEDIVQAVSALRERGVRFLRVPDSYYADAKERMAGIDLPWGDLERLGILVDRDHDGHLLQVFTETVTDRPTVFFEIIQREGAKGFGEGNFKALFEAIEREQDRRGNL
ncbi:MAG TPA: 4-hydroxyphenylpyruvate dioxygenase [Acidimicrobiales bacterium]|nr:4-hydroxyphenylpyruvate dioxygenase [Acidimicrobiales bacterium]